MTAATIPCSADVIVIPGCHALAMAHRIQRAGYELELWQRGDVQRLRGVPRDGSLWRERRPHRHHQYGHGVTPGDGPFGGDAA